MLSKGQSIDIATKLSQVHLPLNSHVLQSISLTVSVVKEQLLPLQDSSLGEDSNAVVSVDHHNFSVAVGIN